MAFSEITIDLLRNYYVNYCDPAVNAYDPSDTRGSLGSRDVGVDQNRLASCRGG